MFFTDVCLFTIGYSVTAHPCYGTVGTHSTGNYMKMKEIGPLGSANAFDRGGWVNEVLSLRE